MAEKRENNFGAIRLIGAAIVIIGHMYTLVGGTVPSVMWTTLNALGIAVFFSIGGYLITISWQREPHFFRYLIKRVFRIFPALIACILFCVFLVGPIATEMPLKQYFTHIMTWRYMQNMALYMKNIALPMVFYDNPYPAAVNGSLWCLPVEFFMYLVIPVYLSIGAKLPEKIKKGFFCAVTLIFIGIGCAYVSVEGLGDTVFYGVYIRQAAAVIPYYFMGSLIALCKLEKYMNLQTAMALLIVSTGFPYLSEPYAHFASYFLVPYVFLSFALAEKPAFVKLNQLDISYGMFLFSFVIQQSLIQIFIRLGAPLNLYVLMLLSLVLSVGMGIVTERLVERPMQKVSKKLLARFSLKI